LADNFRFAQLQPFLLAGSGAVIGDTSVTLQSMTDIDGNALSMATDFGQIGYGTIEPGNGANEEQISFSGLTNNANGTVTLTGVKNVSFLYPYTETSGLAKTHAGATTFVISNTSGFYSAFVAKDDDGTISETLTFTQPNFPQMDSYVAPTTNVQLAPKKYVDDIAVAGAPNAGTSTKGIVQIATRAQYDAGTLVGSTSAYLVVTPDILNSYIVDTGSPNAIVITPSPAIASYVAGQRFSVKLANTNTSPSVTFNVNGVGAKSVVMATGASPNAGALASGQILLVEFNSPYIQVLSPSANTVITTTSPSVGDLLYYGGTSGWVRLAATTSPYVLTSNGTTTPPSWSSFALGGRTAIGTFSPSGTGTKTITGLSFTPSLIKVLAYDSSIIAGAAGISTSEGWSNGSTTVSTYASASNTLNNTGTGSNLVQTYYMTSGPALTLGFAMTLTSLDSGGATFNVATNAHTPSMIYVAYE